MHSKFTVLAVAASLAVAGTAQAQQASHASYQPPTDVWVSHSKHMGGFQSHVVGDTSERLRAFPHAWTKAELTDIATGVGMLHKRVRVRLGLPKAHRVVCEAQRRLIQCRVLNRRGKSVAWYPVDRVFEDGSTVGVPAAGAGDLREPRLRGGGNELRSGDEGS